MSLVNTGKFETAFDGGICTLYGKSTYTKPLPEKDDELLGGKVLFIYEEDTKNIYKYDYFNKNWVLQSKEALEALKNVKGLIKPWKI